MVCLLIPVSIYMVIVTRRTQRESVIFNVFRSTIIKPKKHFENVIPTLYLQK